MMKRIYDDNSDLFLILVVVYDVNSSADYSDGREHINPSPPAETPSSWGLS